VKTANVLDPRLVAVVGADFGFFLTPADNSLT